MRPAVPQSCEEVSCLRPPRRGRHVVLDEIYERCRLGDLIPIGAHHLQMQIYGFAYIALRFLDRSASRNAAGEIWHISAIVVFCLLKNYGPFSHSAPPRFSPACLRIDPSVPVFKSSPGLPATVTLPGLAGCTKPRWLPRVAFSRQPSFSSIRITSRTFMGLHHRAVGIEVADGILWFWIGTHAGYDTIVS